MVSIECFTATLNLKPNLEQARKIKTDVVDGLSETIRERANRMDKDFKSAAENIAKTTEKEYEERGYVTEAYNLAVELEHKVLRKMFDKIVECECGPGTEIDEVALKVPFDQDEQVLKVLGEAGYDVGTDAFYEDPDNFVTVIVRPGKSTLRR